MNLKYRSQDSYSFSTTFIHQTSSKKRHILSPHAELSTCRFLSKNNLCKCFDALKGFISMMMMLLDDDRIDKSMKQESFLETFQETEGGCKS